MKVLNLLFAIFCFSCGKPNTYRASIYNEAFSINLPLDVIRNPVLPRVWADKSIHRGQFLNKDSSVIVKITIYKEFIDDFEKLLPYELNMLHALEPNMKLEEQSVFKQNGKEMMSILYELNHIQSGKGTIAERRMFNTTKGGVELNIECEFKNSAEKEKCFVTIKNISESIRVD